MDGTIVKGISGFYYVKSGDVITQCKARGILKKDEITPLVGDEVNFEVLPDGDGIINSIHERKNSFIRPPVANVDQFIIVVSAAHPKTVLSIIDKFLVMAEESGTEIALCINKIDLDKKNTVEKLKNIYESIYPVYCVSGKTGQGTDELKKIMYGKRTAFAGPSGVGKSTLLNCIDKDIAAATDDISSKTKRGKHTTRHVEIFQLEKSGQVYDTPGFTSFDVINVEENQLHYYYPEMKDYIGKCKYDNCRHIKEPGCAVIKALEDNKIKESRYNSYVSQIEDIRKKKNY